MDPDTEVDHESMFVRIYKSGRLERLIGTDIVPASLDPTTAVTSKDVVIDPVTGVAARIYLPTLSTPKKLPILVYFHGGAFIIESAFSPTYHNYLNSLASKAGLLIVSVEYRRAPEHHLPAAHDDSWAALKWVVSYSVANGTNGPDDPDPWLAEHGDFSRIFLAGDSAGGNLAHHMAVRVAAKGVKVTGMGLIHPFFASEASPKHPREAAIKKLTCNGSVEGEELLLLPTAGMKAVGCKRVMVFVAEKDRLKARGTEYYERLVASGWGGKAELVETKEEGHVFHLINPECENAVKMMEGLVSFFKADYCDSHL